MKVETAALLYHRVFGTPLVKGAVSVAGRMLPAPRLETNRYEIQLMRLPAASEGLRILHLSDLHLRDAAVADELSAAVRELDYDLAVFTGDFIDDNDGTPFVDRLLRDAEIRSPAIAVFGNHDHWALQRSRERNDVRRLHEVLTDHGVQVLSNKHVVLGALGATIVGVDDPVTGNADLPAAMSGVAADAFVILLAHSPDILLDLDGIRPDLVLSGHAHGGQIRLPVIGPVINMTSLPRPEIMGRRDHGDVVSFVHRGVGYSGVRVRFRCEPEIALLTLRGAVG